MNTMIKITHKKKIPPKSPKDIVMIDIQFMRVGLYIISFVSPVFVI